MARKAAVISIDINAGTAKMLVDLEKAKGGLREFGAAGAGANAGMVSSTKATTAVVKALEGQFDNNTKAATAFITKVLGAGPILQAAFPIFGLAAFGGLVVNIGDKFVGFVKSIQEAPSKMANAFRELNQPLKDTNDQLDLTNAKLANDIARLEGKPENKLAESLAEARVEADALAKSLEADMEALNKLMKEQSVGMWQRFIGSMAGTDDIQEAAQNLAKDIQHENTIGETAVANAKTKEEAKAAREAWEAALAARYKYYQAWKDHQIDVANAAAKPHVVTIPGSGYSPATEALQPGTDEAARLNALHGFGDQLALQQSFIGKKSLESKLTGEKGGLEGLGNPNKAAEDQLKAWERQLDQEKFQDAVTLQEEQSFWSQRLAIAASRGAAYDGVVDAIQKKILEGMRRGIEQAKRNDEEDLKVIESNLKATMERVRQAGGNPEATRLQMLQGIVDSPNGLSADVVDKIAQQIPDAQEKADREATENLKRTLGEQDQAWHESGERSAAEVKARATSLRTWLEEVRPFFVGIDALIDEQTAKIIEANKKLQEQADKLATIHRESATQTATGANETKRLELERQYSASRTHSFQEEAAYRKQLADLEAADLQIKLQAAGIAHEEAMDEGDEVKMAQADLEIEKSRLAIQKQRLQVAIQETQARAQHPFAGGDLQSGYRQFFADLADKAKKPGEILYDGLTSALDKVSDQLGNLFTGKKTSFGKVFEDLGTQMVKETTKSALQEGLSKVGTALGIKLPGSTHKPTLAAGDPGHVIVDNMGGGKSLPGAPDGDETPDQNAVPGNPINALRNFAGSIGGGISSLFGGLKGLFTGAGSAASSATESVTSSISFMSGGGDADPGKIYGIAEKGEGEFVTPRNASTITPLSKMGFGNTTVNNNIDARGAALGVENRIARAIEASHQSGVATAVRANAERTKRTPQRR